MGFLWVMSVYIIGQEYGETGIRLGQVPERAGRALEEAGFEYIQSPFPGYPFEVDQRDLTARLSQMQWGDFSLVSEPDYNGCPRIWLQQVIGQRDRRVLVRQEVREGLEVFHIAFFYPTDLETYLRDVRRYGLNRLTPRSLGILGLKMTRHESRQTLEEDRRALLVGIYITVDQDGNNLSIRTISPSEASHLRSLEEIQPS